MNERKRYCVQEGFVDITVCVNEVWYRVPWYCLAQLLWPLPADYEGDRYVWADNPMDNTSLEMLRAAIIGETEKFKSFIL